MAMMPLPLDALRIKALEWRSLSHTSSVVGNNSARAKMVPS